jgi:predicted RecB family nuclease
MDITITSELLDAYTECRRAAFLLIQGDAVGVQHEYCRALANRTATARQDLLAAIGQGGLPSDSRRIEYAASPNSNPALRVHDLSATCDAIVPRGPDGGSIQYEPHLAVGTRSISRGHRMQVTFAGFAVGELYGHRPTHGAIAPFNDTLQRVRLLPLYPAVEAIIDVLREWGRHLPVDPPPLLLNRNCAKCTFHRICLKGAEEQDNLTLLERMTPKLMRKYGKRGTFTINQLSYAYRPRRRRKRPASAPPSFNIELQALAIRTGKICLHEPPVLPRSSVELFLDIEGLPDEGFHYLFGLDVREDTQVTTHSFWADSAEQEGDVFARCMDLAARYPDAPVFHYGSYEPRALALLAEKHKIKCDWLAKRLVNVNKQIFGKAYFPAKSNRLKDLGPLVGAAWSSPDPSGLQSIAWRWRWEDTHDSKYKDLLLAYNREDCRALRLLTTELQGMSGNTEARENFEFLDAPRQNTTPAGKHIHRIFEDIIKAAHSQYKQKRVCVRQPVHDAESAVAQSPRKGHRPPCAVRALPRGVGRTIRVHRKRRCPRHPTHPLTASERTATHALIDLAFGRLGCRKTTVRYVGVRAHCSLCHFDYLPPAIRRLQGRVFGHGFEAWTVYQHVALRLPYSAICQTSMDLLSEPLKTTTILNFMARFAEEYASTENRLLRGILQSPFVHVDETKINIMGMNQYVWVLTDGKHVVFRRTETRESTFIQTLLNGYEGVLISDFYGGYDAVKCRQQKCLVHLIRDLNDDLWKNPFNQQYESFVGTVRDLLLLIFADMDRYGSKRRHLHKHGNDVDRFFRAAIDCGESECEIVAKYQKRFLRYRDSLFRFLDEDGLPWNNNTAEQAIRHLAIQRKISGSFSGTGADAHLSLLGIAQTCRFQNKSFLRFLLSGQLDVDEYVEKRRRRRVGGKRNAAGAGDETPSM